MSAIQKYNHARNLRRLSSSFCMCFFLASSFNSSSLFDTSLKMSVHSFIAKRISTRHWIADCGPRIDSCMYVCMYVCPSHFWNAIKAPHV